MTIQDRALAFLHIFVHFINLLFVKHFPHVAEILHQQLGWEYVVPHPCLYLTEECHETFRAFGSKFGVAFLFLVDDGHIGYH